MSIPEHHLLMCLYTSIIQPVCTNGQHFLANVSPLYAKYYCYHYVKDSFLVIN
jgi:hypothetical protein